MNDSADSLREQRKRETSRALTDAARRLTASEGFAGFTIEELCTEVGVSRRTFFNYFESKEHAVFGFTTIDSRQEALEEEFVSQRGDLLDDFLQLTIGRFELFNPVDDAPAMFAVIEQEPRLLKAAFEQLAKNERRDIGLILRRTSETVDAELRAEVIVHTVGALIRMSMDQLLHHQSTETFGELIARRLELARSLYAPSQKDH
ncbi:MULTISPECIES: TetR/AcrR family transcriptional regulator [unclassified Microbacterium]|uniref:TetR/AcrR family transcriptional regulator n=1 Tax=unclassified Microbacterium TaxID=2609290 RepID=UPI001604F26B|nr:MULTISPECIES: TetR/AcrR family transcriptional regulator [unclassified Microbacterium]QNA91961.1 TetR/AcrR family transcriptional regulator [Microbacterium sp. Se63.02b]QYM65190.1 TetR/AcrR family transcriptional regulator [Microbacterium sp. Se5.02b]